MGSKAPSRVRIPQSPPVTSERLTDVQRRFIIPLLRNAPVAQLDRAPGYELGGRRFESFRARQNNRPLAGFFVPGGLPARRGRRAFAPARSGASRAAVAHPSGRAKTTGHWPVFLCPADLPARRGRRAFAPARSDASRAAVAHPSGRARTTGHWPVFCARRISRP